MAMGVRHTGPLRASRRSRESIGLQVHARAITMSRALQVGL